MLYDCFTFSNELDVLEIRLHELAGVADRFVLIEAAETFTGRAKPLCFHENWKRFSDFPIIHLPLSHLEGGSAWAREAYTRAQFARAIPDAMPDDAVLVGDVDEIPFRHDLMHKLKLPGQQSFTMALTRYYADYQCTSHLWQGTQLTSVADLRKRGGQAVRDSRTLQPFGKIEGLHMTMLGGADALRTKFMSFSHTEMQHPRFHAPGFIEHEMENLQGRDMQGYWYQKVDGNYPCYLAANMEQYKHLFSPEKQQRLAHGVMREVLEAPNG